MVDKQKKIKIITNIFFRKSIDIYLFIIKTLFEMLTKQKMKIEIENQTNENNKSGIPQGLAQKIIHNNKNTNGGAAWRP